jgi:hypothetical protein
MPSLAAPLKKWIAQCKAYAAKHGCSYKEAMTALKKSRKASHRGGGVADNAAAVGGAEGFENPSPSAPAHASAPPAHAGAPPAPPAPPTQPQSGGQSMFEAGAPAQTQSQAGGKRRRKLSKRKRSQNRSRSQSQQGGKRGGRSRGRGRRQTKRGGAALSYSAY